MFTPTFTGTSKTRNINLGSRDPASQLSSSAVLARAREERRARERTRLEGQSALTIQRTWRGRRAAGRVAARLLDEVEIQEGVLDRRREGRVVALVCRGGIGRDVDGRRRRALARWAEKAVQMEGGCPAALKATQSAETYLFTLIRLSVLALQVIAQDPLSSDAAACARLLECLFDSAPYRSLANGERRRQAITERIASGDWVECLTRALRAVPPTSKKHPNMPALVRLLTLPLDSLPADSPVRVHLLPAYFYTLLAVPSLPSLMPLASLTYFCTHLPLFNAIFPAVLDDPAAFSSGAIRTERDRTELLANLVTLVVRGGMLARQNAAGAGQWMQVVGRLLSGMDDQWGMWIEGKGVWARGADQAAADKIVRHSRRAAGDSSDVDVDMDADTDDEAAKGIKARIQARGSVPPTLAAKILPILDPAHLLGLVGQAMRNEVLVLPVVSYIQGLLSAFRGSARWEAILDVLLEGEQGRKLIRQLWRGHVRGKWSRTTVKDNWEKMFNSEATTGTAGKANSAPFLLLSTLYIHHLLSIPDAEFFSPESAERNALSIDEMTELAGIWRDLAFYGYWVGVGASDSLARAAKKSEEKKREDVRALMTKGVVAVRARDARRRFTPPDFWIMTSEFNLHSFVEAVLIEESQLDAPEEPQGDPEAEQLVVAARPPPWMRGRRHISKRQMAFISPRLGLLNNLPMTVPFETRVEIFQQFIRNDRERLGIDQYIRRHGSRHSARIRRPHLAEDGFKELNKLGRLLKGTIEIKFYDEWGNREAGIDGGGLFKEFLTSLSKEVFDTDRGLWLATSQNELYPNPHSYATEAHQLEWYSFIGRVLGKAMYEGILVDVSFAGFFLAKWLARQSFLDDLASLDADLYKGLIALKNYPGDPEDLALNFTIAEDDFGMTRSIDLLPNGSNISVNRTNRNEYIQLVCDYKLNRQISKQCLYFFSGLSEMIDPKWLRMFDQQELQTLLGGTESPIDIDDFQRHTVMSDDEDDITYKLFWKVVRSFNQDQLKALLKFVTSCARPPLLGFGDLQPKFGIRLTVGDTTRLPSASSCFNLLKLPRYKDEYTLRDKLLQAITSGAGFDLS